MPKLIQQTLIGPYYQFFDEFNNLLLEMHRDLSTYGWRVSYPGGTSNLHTGMFGAQQEATKYLESRGYKNKDLYALTH